MCLLLACSVLLCLWLFLTMPQVGLQCVLIVGLQSVIVSVALPNDAAGWSAVCAYGWPAVCNCDCGYS